ncbi:MAG: phosphomannose isomerase type II C-terminal cupin domain [Gammaproteobacteria bacterium]
MTNEVNQVYHRPWGSYQTLALGDNYQVKILTIQPGGRLSLQKHFRRCEHWVVVQGNPTLTIGDEQRVYQINEAVYIPIEAKHRIENFTEGVCVLIEVQVGDYLGEDDIVRFEDVYGR